MFRTEDEAWDFFEKLAWDTYEFEQVKEILGYPAHCEFNFPANPYHQDHYRNSYDLLKKKGIRL